VNQKATSDTSRRIWVEQNCKETRFAAFLPEAHREQTQNRATVLPVCVDDQFTGGVMKSKVVVCSLGFLSFLAITTRGQEYSKVDLFTGYSYVRANPSGGTLPQGATSQPSFNMNGGEASVAYNVNNWFSGVFDFAGYRTSQLLSNPPLKGNMYTYIFGPRVSYRHLGRITPFAQTLFGIAHGDTYLVGTKTEFAMTVGGGFDYSLSRHLSVRPIQADYLLTRFEEEFLSGKRTQNNVRLSTGLVFHF
jgi:opacity protein-like surface antigen